MEIELIKKLDGRVNRRFGTKLVERMRVAAYCRVSSDSEDQLNSYQSQVKYYENKINENEEWEFVDIYADIGADIPWITKLVINVSGFIGKYYLFIFGYKCN